jgi:acyl-[acyl-carrier-protein] desaturase
VLARGAMPDIERQLYQQYVDFFDRAERERRWNPLRDIPWGEARPEISEELVVVAETFCAVESYLPDYVAKGINLVRGHFGQAWFAANWAYEESKHALVLMEYLMRSGRRTPEQLLDFQSTLKSREWSLPFTSAPQMTLYGCLQEMATFVIYCKQEARAKREGDGALAAIFRLIARDELAHTRFYEDVIKVLLVEDRAGTLADLAKVVREFEMPGVSLVPDYDRRIEVMREAGIDRSVFLQKVFFPVLKRLGTNRAELIAHSSRN